MLCCLITGGTELVPGTAFGSGLGSANFTVRGLAGLSDEMAAVVLESVAAEMSGVVSISLMSASSTDQRTTFCFEFGSS